MFMTLNNLLIYYANIIQPIVIYGSLKSFSSLELKILFHFLDQFQQKQINLVSKVLSSGCPYPGMTISILQPA